MNQTNRTGEIKIRLGALSISLSLVSVALLTSLVIVSSIREADLLSVVALVVAILAFAAQLIIYIVQASDASNSHRRSLLLHAELSGLLAEMRERTSTTQRSVETINARLLEAIISKENLGPHDTLPETIARQVVGLSPNAQRPTSQRFNQNQDLYPPPMEQALAQQIHSFMGAWPSPEEVNEIQDVLFALPEDTHWDLYRVANDLKRFTGDSSSYGPGVHYDEALDEAGLLEKVKGWKLYTLSAKGRKVGRLFTADGEPPSHIAPLIQIRNRVAAADARITRANENNRDPSDA